MIEMRKPVKYSETEQKMLKFLSDEASEQAMSSNEIVDKWWIGERRPYHDRQIINGIIRGLIEKMKLNRERRIQIVKSPRAGPHPITYRVVRRPGRPPISLQE